MEQQSPRIEIAEGVIPVRLEGIEEAESRVARLKQELADLSDAAASFQFGPPAQGEQRRDEPVMGMKFQTDDGETRVRITAGQQRVEDVRRNDAMTEMVQLLRDIKELLEAREEK